MADGISVVCANCGREFVVGEDLAGGAVACPQCESQVAVPLPQDVAQQRPRLQVRRGTPVSGGKPCPSCGAAMADGAVICVQCGFDTRTGVTWQTKPADRRPIGLVLAAVGVVIVAGWIHIWLKSRRESGPIGEMPAAPPTQSAPAVAPAAAGGEVSSAEPAPVTEGPAAALATAEPPRMPESDMGAQADSVSLPAPSRAELERQFTEALNTRYPLHTRGAQVVLRQNNGLVHRGEILVLGPESVTLKTEQGVREVPFTSLDAESRLRCDPEGRRRLVNARVERMLSAPAPR